MGIKGKVYGGLGVWGGEASQSTVSGGSDRVRSGFFFCTREKKEKLCFFKPLKRKKKIDLIEFFYYNVINSKSVVVECSSIVKNKSQNKSLISTDRSN